MNHVIESFIVHDNHNSKVRCDILFTLKNENQTKEYIVYTDNSRDRWGELNVYISIKTPCKDGKFKLSDVSDEEWNFVVSAYEKHKTEKYKSQKIEWINWRTML